MQGYGMVLLATALLLLAVLTARIIRRNPRLFAEPLPPGPLAKGDSRVAFYVTTRGLLAGVAALLQLSAAYFPGLGHFLSAFAALPISVAAASGPASGVWTYVAAAGVILAGQPGELPIFAFTTGPLGLAVGWGAAQKLGRWLVWAIAASVFFVGMAVLTYVAGVPALGEEVGTQAPRERMMALFAVFAGAYAWAWLLLTEEIFRRLGYGAAGPQA